MRRFLVALLVLLVAGSNAAAADEADFATQIQPIFKANCYKCHADKVQKGDLSLHTSAGLLDYVVIPGDLEISSLYQRLIEEDEELRMPQGADPLPAGEIELIKLWIEQGAKMPEGSHLDLQPVAEEPGEEVPPASPAVLEEIASSGALVLPLSSGSNLLTVSFATLSRDVDDELITPLAGAKEQITWLNLAGTGITDQSLATIGELKNLTKLHLENTGVTDAGLEHLSALEKLEYLNLYGTEISDAGLEHLKPLGSLKKLYLWQTKANYEPAMALQDSIEGLEVNLGWNHPEVRRARLMKELERATQQKEDAAAREEAARAEKEAAAEREAEAQKELEELEKDLSGESPAADETATAEGDQTKEEPVEKSEDADDEEEEEKQKEEEKEKDENIKDEKNKDEK